MSKPGIDRQTRPGTDDTDENVPVTPEVERIVRQRNATYDEDRKTASPAAEVRERLLRRHPAP